MTRSEAARRAANAYLRNHRYGEALERQLVLPPAEPDDAWLETTGELIFRTEEASRDLEFVIDTLLAGGLEKG